ncbi:hypothetical protein [Rhizobium leguminosarum]|nr:hypothetical protein [Rhizobium leguminosarum]
MTYQNNPLLGPVGQPVTAPTPTDIAAAEARQAAMDAQSYANDANDSAQAAAATATEVATQIQAAQDIVTEVEEAGEAAKDFTPIVYPGTSLTINAANAATYNGRYISFTSSSAVTLTMGNNITGTFFCMPGQASSGRITIGAASGASMVSPQLLFKTRAKGSIASVILNKNDDGSSAEYFLGGDVAV